MSHLQAFKPSEDPELFHNITFVQTLLCAVTNPSIHGAELLRYGVEGEPERLAVKIRLEQELWRLIDQIPLPVPECFLEFINSELFV
jgi:hypothetical protein